MTSTNEDLKRINKSDEISIIDPTMEGKSEGMISQQEAVAMYAGAGAADKSEKEQKFVALFKARTIISHIGTMEERRISLKQLKRMKDLGLGSV